MVGTVIKADTMLLVYVLLLTGKHESMQTGQDPVLSLLIVMTEVE
jgi:hypothetical protein